MCSRAVVMRFVIPVRFAGPKSDQTLLLCGVPSLVFRTDDPNRNLLCTLWSSSQFNLAGGKRDCTKINRSDLGIKIKGGIERCDLLIWGITLIMARGNQRALLLDIRQSQK